MAFTKLDPLKIHDDFYPEIQIYEKMASDLIKRQQFLENNPNTDTEQILVNYNHYIHDYLALHEHIEKLFKNIDQFCYENDDPNAVETFNYLSTELTQLKNFFFKAQLPTKLPEIKARFKKDAKLRAIKQCIQKTESLLSFSIKTLTELNEIYQEKELPAEAKKVVNVIINSSSKVLEELAQRERIGPKLDLNALKLKLNQLNNQLKLQETLFNVHSNCNELKKLTKKLGKLLAQQSLPKNRAKKPINIKRLNKYLEAYKKNLADLEELNITLGKFVMQKYYQQDDVYKLASSINKLSMRFVCVFSQYFFVTPQAEFADLNVFYQQAKQLFVNHIHTYQYSMYDNFPLYQYYVLELLSYYNVTEQNKLFELLAQAYEKTTGVKYDENLLHIYTSESLEHYQSHALSGLDPVNLSSEQTMGFLTFSWQKIYSFHVNVDGFDVDSLETLSKELHYFNTVLSNYLSSVIIENEEASFVSINQAVCLLLKHVCFPLIQEIQIQIVGFVAEEANLQIKLIQLIVELVQSYEKFINIHKNISDISLNYDQQFFKSLLKTAQQKLKISQGLIPAVKNSQKSPAGIPKFNAKINTSRNKISKFKDEIANFEFKKDNGDDYYNILELYFECQVSIEALYNDFSNFTEERSQDFTRPQIDCTWENIEALDEKFADINTKKFHGSLSSHGEFTAKTPEILLSELKVFITNNQLLLAKINEKIFDKSEVPLLEETFFNSIFKTIVSQFEQIDLLKEQIGTKYAKLYAELALLKKKAMYAKAEFEIHVRAEDIKLLVDDIKLLLNRGEEEQEIVFLDQALMDKLVNDYRQRLTDIQESLASLNENKTDNDKAFALLQLLSSRIVDSVRIGSEKDEKNFSAQSLEIYRKYLGQIYAVYLEFAYNDNVQLEKFHSYINAVAYLVKHYWDIGEIAQADAILAKVDSHYPDQKHKVVSRTKIQPWMKSERQLAIAMTVIPLEELNCSSLCTFVSDKCTLILNAFSSYGPISQHDVKAINQELSEIINALQLFCDKVTAMPLDLMSPDNKKAYVDTLTTAAQKALSNLLSLTQELIPQLPCQLPLPQFSIAKAQQRIEELNPVLKLVEAFKLFITKAVLEKNSINDTAVSQAHEFFSHQTGLISMLEAKIAEQQTKDAEAHKQLLKRAMTADKTFQELMTNAEQHSLKLQQQRNAIRLQKYRKLQQKIKVNYLPPVHDDTMDALTIQQREEREVQEQKTKKWFKNYNTILNSFAKPDSALGAKQRLHKIHALLMSDTIVSDYPLYFILLVKLAESYLEVSVIQDDVIEVAKYREFSYRYYSQATDFYKSKIENHEVALTIKEQLGMYLDASWKNIYLIEQSKLAEDITSRSENIPTELSLTELEQEPNTDELIRPQEQKRSVKHIYNKNNWLRQTDSRQVFLPVSTSVQKLLDLTETLEIEVVAHGGVARDLYLNLNNDGATRIPRDIDISLKNYPVSEFQKRMQEAYPEVDTLMVGKKTSILLAQFPDELIEVVEWTNPVERDITLNALDYDFKTNTISGPKIAFDDLNNKITRTCKEEDVTFREDFGRIFRVCIFNFRFNFTFPPSFNKFMRNDNCVSMLNQSLSSDITSRSACGMLTHYMKKILDSGYASEVFNYLHTTKPRLLELIFPSVYQDMSETQQGQFFDVLLPALDINTAISSIPYEHFIALTLFTGLHSRLLSDSTKVQTQRFTVSNINDKTHHFLKQQPLFMTLDGIKKISQLWIYAYNILGVKEIEARNITPGEALQFSEYFHMLYPDLALTNEPMFSDIYDHHGLFSGSHGPSVYPAVNNTDFAPHT